MRRVTGTDFRLYLRLASLFATIHVLGDAVQADGPVTLMATADPSPCRVRIVFEVDGHLLPGLAPANGENPAASTEPRPEFKAMGEFLYEERLAKDHPGRALRYYEQAEAELAIDGRPRHVSLRDDRRFIAVDAKTAADEAGIRSLAGPLTRDELELLELPAGSQLVHQLLPGRAIKAGETWLHDDHLLAQLLNLTGVTVNEVASRLDRVDADQGVAQLTLGGKVLGYAAGVVTEITLAGKYHFDLRQQRITWLALSLVEDRPTGTAKPGLNVKARLRMLIEPTAATAHLTAESLGALASAAPSLTGLLEYRPAHGRFVLLHDRRWHLFREQSELTVMRLIDDGQVIAQCNLRSLPPHPSHQASLANFQQEIRTALGSAAKQVIDADQSVHASGAQQLRVAIIGEVSNAAVNWIYYQLTDDRGHLLTCVFTMSGENVERFSSEDVSFMSSVTLGPAPPETEVTPPADASEGPDDKLALEPGEAPQ